MTHTPATTVPTVRAALAANNSQTRLRAALEAGTNPDAVFIDELIARSADEPDFFVRDMLTWALTRHDHDRVIPRLLGEVSSTVPQARSQALHTLSKIGDRSVWAAIPLELLTDDDDEVARSAWRAAVVIAADLSEVAAILVSQLGRGNDELQRSLSRAFVEIGDVALPLIEQAATAADRNVRAHAMATKTLMLDPDAGFAASLHEAQRVVALG